MIGQDMGEGGEFNEEKDENGPRLTKKKKILFKSCLYLSIRAIYSENLSRHLVGRV